MPSILFHELVGYQFAKKHKKYDTPNFYLGAMVPDAVNAYGFASKEERWQAHLRDENLEKWQTNILNFYKENHQKQENTYLMGYLVHVLTDIICDQIYQQKLYPDLLKKGYDYHTAYAYYERAIEKFENHNIKELWWNKIKINIQTGDKIPINGIGEKMITDWIECTIEKYENRKYEEEGYITIEFVKEVLNKIQKVLETENIG